MEWWAWLLIAAVALPVGWHLLKVLAGAAVPLETSGRLYLLKELKKRNIAPGQLGDAATMAIVKECLEIADGMLQLKLSREARSTLMVAQLDVFIRWIDAELAGIRVDLFREVLTRHGIADLELWAGGTGATQRS